MLEQGSGQPARPQFGEMMAMMFWYGVHWMWWQASLMWFVMIVFWGLLILGIYALISTALRRPGDREQGGDARRILDQRLAHGEIDAEEYRHLRDLIGSEQSGRPVSSGTNS
jgi:putative membrane protein